MQNHTLKLFLRKDKENKFGQQPICIRLTINRKSSIRSTSHFIFPKQWDERHEAVINHPLAEEINLDLVRRKKELMQTLINASVKGKHLTAADVNRRVNGANIFDFYDLLKKDLQHKRTPALLEIWRKHLLKLEAFNRNRKLAFEEITPEYLNAFESWLRNGGINARKKDSSNYIYAIMKTVRTLFNVARKMKVTDCYPFNEYEMPRQTAGNKDYLSIEELDLWTAAIPALPDGLKSPAVWFLFGCYTGLRNSDWYLFDFKRNVKRDYLQLRARKNGQWVVVPLYERLRSALELVQAMPIEKEPIINQRLKEIARLLNIDKYLSTHSARRTFAVSICLGKGISSETAAEMMGITLQVFISNYAAVTDAKIKSETEKAWAGM